MEIFEIIQTFKKMGGETSAGARETCTVEARQEWRRELKVQGKEQVAAVARSHLVD